MQALVHSDGRLVLRNEVYRIALGRSGVRADKREGDGATPAGLLPLRRVLYRPDRVPPPACALPLEPLARADGWCDDPTNAEYNRMVRLPHGAHCEVLWREDALYDVVAVLGWNDRPVQRGRGSAIFLHVAAAGYAPTEGCISLALSDLTRVLATGTTQVLVLPA